MRVTGTALVLEAASAVVFATLCGGLLGAVMDSILPLIFLPFGALIVHAVAAIAVAEWGQYR
jgi:hypothetical protein